MKKLSIQELNSLFEFVNQQINTCFWIISPDYKKQIYVSQPFENIWERPCSQQYDNPQAWASYLANNQYYKESVRQLDARRPKKERIPTDVILYQIYTPDQEIKYIRDKSFFITDNANNIIATAGISESITQAQWEEAYITPSKDEMKAVLDIQKNLTSILKKEFHHKIKSADNITSNINKNKGVTIMLNNQAIHFTERESQCLHHLLHGKSAKQTAILLGISYRTVEIFLEKIKTKIGARTKLELIAKIDKSMLNM